MVVVILENLLDYLLLVLTACAHLARPESAEQYRVFRHCRLLLLFYNGFKFLDF